MEARDIPGLAGSAVIGLLVLAVTPWSGPWWFGLILAVSIAGVWLIGIAVRHFKIAPDLNIPLIASAILTMLFVVSLAIWGFWPVRTDESQFARFHIVSTEVAFSSQNRNQLIANIYFQNDAGDADVVVYGATGLATQAADQAVIDQLRKVVADLVKEGNGIHFKIRSKEIKWFTAQSSVLSVDQVEKYNRGEFTFYFMTTILINEKEVIKSMDSCGFVVGNNPRAIIDCPSTTPPKQ
jgi:hypothetical protein